MLPIHLIVSGPHKTEMIMNRFDLGNKLTSCGNSVCFEHQQKGSRAKTLVIGNDNMIRGPYPRFDICEGEFSNLCTARILKKNGSTRFQIIFYNDEGFEERRYTFLPTL